MNADVQRLEAERLRPSHELDPLDEAFRTLIGLLAALWTTPPDPPRPGPDADGGPGYEWRRELTEDTP